MKIIKIDNIKIPVTNKEFKVREITGVFPITYTFVAQ